ncbi:MAG: CPBP family intramembrane metalloprotease [bacterium]|nr:CPBP family intramembrane metalloprotease [bacterium]
MSDEDPEDYEYEPPPPLNTAFVLMLALGAPLVHLFSLLIMQGMGLTPGITTIGMATIITYGMLFSLCAPRIPEPVGESLGFVPARRAAWIAVPFLLWSLLISSEVDNLLKGVFPLPESLTADTADPPMFGTALVVVLMIVFPIAYEFFFRGVMQPIVVGELGPPAGIVITAALCGFASGMGVGLPWLILPGIVNALMLGVLRHASGSIKPGLLMHMAAGGLGVLAHYRALGIPGFDRTDVTHTPLGWLIAAAAFTGVGLRLCRHAAETPIPQEEPGD